MLRSRIIPCLLIQNGGLVKTEQFKNPKYLGDPLNAVRIFNEKQADELVVLDIDASRKGVEPDYGLIGKIASECRMPLCYGGGIKSVEQASKIIDLGVEKVALSSAVIETPRLINELAATLGSQSVTTVLDVRKKSSFWSPGYQAFTHNASVRVEGDPQQIIKDFERRGAGEVMINVIDKDGTMSGYDLELASAFKSRISVPFTILGGAGRLDDLRGAIEYLGTVGVAAGSLYVFKGKYRAVLINYPDPVTKAEKLSVLK